jgi:hypothetical protein
MLVTTGIGVGLVMAMLDDGVNGVNAGVADKAVGATVLATMAWFTWRVTVYPCVEASESGLTVRQPFTSYKAPWHAVGTPDALDGLRVPLAGHGVVTSWAFSASLLADFMGDLAANNTVARLDQMRRAAVPDARIVERHRTLGLATLGLAWAVGLTTAVLASLV